MHLTDLYEDCLKYLLIEKGETPDTIRTYRANFCKFMSWLNDKGLPDEIFSLADHTILRQFMYHLHEKGLQKNTIRLHMFSIKALCMFLLREGILRGNPFDRFDIPKKVKGVPRPLSDPYRDKLLSQTKRMAESSKSARDIQAAVIMELGARCGLRKKGMMSMTWENTDLLNGYTRILDKGNKDHTYILSPSTIKWLKILKMARGTDKGHVLLSPKSKTPISKTSLQDEFRRYVDILGLSNAGITLHRLRHTYGTDLIAAGMDVLEVKEALCHEDIGSTVGYTEVSKKSLRDKIKKVFSNAK